MNRWSYVLIRVLQVIPTFFVVMVLVFAAARLLPGDPLTAILGERATEEMVVKAKHELGLDQPLPVQFWIFLKDFFQGNLGDSINLKVPVTRLILERMPVTLFLTLYAAVLAAALAIPLAFVAALRKDTWADNLIRGVFQLGLSMPVFYIGLQLLTLLGARLRWFPVGGYGNTFGEHLYYLFLPALTLGFNLAAILMRNLRASILEVLQAEYVDFARAKGLRPSLILGKHVLRNALISTVTLFGLNIGGLIGGAVITETVFAIPGVGRLMVDSIFGRDYPVIQGLTLTFALLVSLVFILTDVIHAQLDPRVEAA
ncbi:ABC transporter permease [Meiothermus granaticius]|uniref:Glutathione transport system permease protein GsiC n=1 Tax=Meiothermus granaticius NBRC 107808 TaxID=1227551 RepID=A0A399F6P3_9DEIN|nr:ABC transporter permease [Meiothermus granaticius]MCL6525272.1 ABC transporter permease [Thermaceae bacterium]RIH91763.1 Glutathione transport system permease protein GsiC [Meiothermus granaticius NBRC 107808]GEM88113.1 peptide ABC transporter permease [Meiothermus granaticius NBRC 107808]